MTIWVYYETDGDSGWYDVSLFSTEQKAEAHQRKKDSAYGHVEHLEVDEVKVEYSFA